MEHGLDQSAELRKKIKEQQYKSIRQCIKYSKQLLALSVSSCDLYGTAFAYRYLSYCYFTENKIKQCFIAGKKAISLSETNNYNDLLPDLYNILGYIYHVQSLEQISIGYFLKGLKVAKAVGNMKTCCYIYSNIGSLYYELKQYKKSLFYLKKAEQVMALEVAKTGHLFPAYVKIIHNMVDWNVELKNFEQAEKILIEADNTVVNSTPEDVSSCLYFHAVIEWNKGNNEGFLKYYNEGLEMFDRMRPNLMSLMGSIDYINLGFKSGHIEACKRLLSFAKKGAQSANLPTFWLKYYKALMQFSQITEDKELEIYAKENWRVWNKKKKANERVQKGLSFKMQEEIKTVQTSYKESKDMHSVLKQASNKDYLTGINNRRSYLEDIKQSIRSLQKKQGNLGLVYIDIDFFKDYNDCFGHVQGDSCIKTVAGTIKESFHDFGTSYRIGGDEFAVIVKEKNIDEIKERMKKLKQNITDLKIAHPMSEIKPYLTVSIGAYVAVPNKSLTVADFYKAADHALYHVKKQARDGFYIVEGKNFENT